MAVFVLEDLVGSIEVMVFPRTMQEIGHKLDDDKVVMIRGRLDKRDDAPKLICMEVDVLRRDRSPAVRRLYGCGCRSSGSATELVTSSRALAGEHPVNPGVIHLGLEVLTSARRSGRRPPNGLAASCACSRARALLRRTCRDPVRTCAYSRRGPRGLLGHAIDARVGS